MGGAEFFVGLGVGIAAASATAYMAARGWMTRIRAAEQRARAAERMAEIGAMTGGLAHEIKNPLSTIGLNAQLLVEGLHDLPVPDEDKGRLINRTQALQRETERLRGILQDFLEFAGQVHLEKRLVDVNALVAELVDFYLPEAERMGVRLRAEPAPGALTAVIDARQVKQAVLNLLLNATQAMSRPENSAPGARSLILRTRPGKDADGRRTVAINVIDTGPGMDSETLGRIFNPYFTTRSGGSGLGLPTARRLIEEHGGRIVVESSPGKGSDFGVILPVDGD